MSGRADEGFSGLDDLFRAEFDEPRARPRVPQSPVGWAWRAGLAAAFVGMIVWFVLRLVGVEVPWPLPVLTVFVLLALLRALRTVAAVPVPLVTTAPTAPGEADLPVDGLDLATWAWRQRLERGRQGFTAVAGPLREIVAERLRIRHGVRPASDPARARALLGGTLWSLLHEPVGRTPNPKDLAAIVAHLEEL